MTFLESLFMPFIGTTIFASVLAICQWTDAKKYKKLWHKSSEDYRNALRELATIRSSRDRWKRIVYSITDTTLLAKSSIEEFEDPLNVPKEDAVEGNCKEIW